MSVHGTPAAPARAGPPVLVVADRRPLVDAAIPHVQAAFGHIKVVRGGGVGMAFDVKVPRGDADAFNLAFGVVGAETFASDAAVDEAVAFTARMAAANETSFVLVALPATEAGLARFAAFQQAALPRLTEVSVDTSTPGGAGASRPPRLSLLPVGDAADVAECVLRVSAGLSRDRRERVRQHFEAQAAGDASHDAACSLLRAVPGVSPGLEPAHVLEVYGAWWKGGGLGGATGEQRAGRRRSTSTHTRTTVNQSCECMTRELTRAPLPLPPCCPAHRSPRHRLRGGAGGRAAE